MDAIELIEQFGATWRGTTFPPRSAMLTEDCVFDATGPGPDGTRHVGPDAIGQAWQPIFDDPDSLFDAEETFAAGDRVVQRWRYSWAGGHIRGVDVFRLRDGLVAEKLSYVKG